MLAELKWAACRRQTEVSQKCLINCTQSCCGVTHRFGFVLLAMDTVESAQLV